MSPGVSYFSAWPRLWARRSCSNHGDDGTAPAVEVIRSIDNIYNIYVFIVQARSPRPDREDAGATPQQTLRGVTSVARWHGGRRHWPDQAGGAWGCAQPHTCRGRTPGQHRLQDATVNGTSRNFTVPTRANQSWLLQISVPISCLVTVLKRPDSSTRRRPSLDIVKFRDILLTVLIEDWYCPCFTLFSSCPIAKTLFQLLLNVVKVVKISHWSLTMTFSNFSVLHYPKLWTIGK